MTIWPAYAAAALAGVWFLIHTFVGGRQVGRVIRSAEGLGPMPRTIAWMCWHFVTVTLLAMTGMFLAAAVVPSTALLWAGTLLAAGFAGVGTFATLHLRQPILSAPQGLLFVPVAVFGGLALIGS